MLFRIRRRKRDGKYVVTAVDQRGREVVDEEWLLRDAMIYTIEHVGPGDTVDIKATL
jgi:hypothetical protein